MKIKLLLAAVVAVALVFVLRPVAAFAAGSSDALPTTGEVIDLLVRGRWFAFTALAIGATVRVLKDQNVKLVHLDKRWRPALAIGLGIVASFFVQLDESIPWTTALAGCISAAIVAMGGHAVIIEWIFGGREIPLPGLSGRNDQPKRDKGSSGPPGANGAVTTSYVGLFGLLALCVGCVPILGCAGGPGQFQRFVDTTVDAVPVIDDTLHASHERELAACADVECVDRVEGEWRPVFLVMQGIREAWCAVAPEAEGCS